ncbi:GDNF family receptor alpha-2a isoform X2 [Neoarius graeffei]|uniref:GDNF family receptor alpha-2a isoform X2 n=1 Tax=Neoarius graeffei TaxID=443677 RepID=UPI00298CBA49|nr:GDNF family receptor alpha-2a isoform X2 [Neoarius graeffei]
MRLYLCSLLLLLDDLSVSVSSSLSSFSSSSPAPDIVDCMKASELCNLSPQCSSRYRIMRQCLVGKDWNSMLASKECQEALEFLQSMPLVECRCKRGMKKEITCLQNYWLIYMGLSEGEDFYEASPYEPLPPVRHSDAFRLASIISGMNAGTGKAQSHCSDSSRTCNQCLDATKACNLNDNCKRQRSNYISMCTRNECNRKRCHKALRQFLERVESQYSFGLLFCSCQDQGCAERRRQTIVPACAYTDKLKPNCLQLRKTCRFDTLCRSRLADFHTHCQMSDEFISTCPNDDYQACLTAYTGLIGTDMTPNYEDANHTDFSISPWCSCRNSGNQEEECEKFLRDFRENTCLRNAIQAFGTDVPKTTASTNPNVPRANPTTYPNITEPDYKNETRPDVIPLNWSVRLKLYTEAWMLSLVFALGNMAL